MLKLIKLSEEIKMLAKNIRLTNLSKFIFVLLIMLSIGVSLAFTSNGMQAFAMNANDTTGSSHVDAELTDYLETLETGASITLKSNALEEADAPNPALAKSEAEQTATITLSGDLWEAVKSGRLTARLLASGTNVYKTLQGSETTLKNASYTVSGAMSGEGEFDTTINEETGNIVDEEYENLEIAPSTLLKEANGNEIKITYKGQWYALESRTGLGTNVAETQVDCQMSFTLEFQFEEVKISVSSTVGGVIKDANGTEYDLSAGAKEFTLGFGDSAIFTAVAKSGYYFLGWERTGSSLDQTTTILDFGKAVSIPSGAQASCNARFQIIEAVESESYSYSTEGQGPVVSAARYNGVYYLTHNYEGVANDGSAVSHKSEGLENITAGPVRAGNYTYTCEFFYRVNGENGTITKGEKIGSFTKEFTIERNVATVERGADNAGSIEFKFGDNLSNLDLSYVATNSADKRTRLYGSVALYLGEELVNVNKLLPLNEEGVEYTFRFTPNDQDNYAVVNNPLIVIVKDKMTDSGVNLLENVRDYTVTKSIATEVDSTVQSNVTELPEGAEVIKVSLRATMTDVSGQYFFIGWRIGTEQNGYTYLTAGQVVRNGEGAVESINGLSYDYYMPYYADENVTDEDKENYKTTSFQAVFVKDTTTQEGNKMSLYYTGAPSNRSASFLPEPSGYQFGAGNMVYYHESDPTNGVSTIPTAIGNHKLTYTIKNTALDVVVDTRVIDYEITISEVNVAVNTVSSVGYGNYNEETGWAQKMYYNLNVSGLVAGGVQKYYYSSDNGVSWTEITETIANGIGCRTSFVTPDVVNATAINSYLFMATNDTHGKAMSFGVLGSETTYKVVAITSNYTIAKIDTVIPTISNVEETSQLNGAWTNEKVDYSATVSYGGSGAVVEVAYGSGSSTWITLDSNVAYISGDVEQTINDFEAIFSISKEFSGKVKFRVYSATGLYSVYETEFDVNVDLTIPTIPSPTANKNVNQFGWIGEATTFTYEIVDLGGSGIASVSAINLSKEGSPATITEVDGKWQIVITDSCQYQISVYDNAGNANGVGLQANVDTVPLIYEFHEESYVIGEWASEESTAIFNVSTGASGARLLYSVDGGDWIPVAEFTPAMPETDSQELVLGYTFPVSETTKSYKLKIQTRAGKEAEIEVGEVKFDLVAPTLTVVTDLSSFQGAVWTANNVIVTFRAFDDQGVVNSGFNTEDFTKSIIVDNGGSETLQDLGNGSYSFEIDKCTTYTITVKDVAGNVVTKEVQANVDPVNLDELELIVKAYVGGGNPKDALEDPSEEDNSAEKEYDFNDWITKENEEPWVRIELQINRFTASGVKVEYSNNGGTSWSALTSTIMPEGNEVWGDKLVRVYRDTEQNRRYSFRLVTGSGKVKVYEPSITNELYVKIDFTTPTLRSETFRVGTDANFPLKTTWTNQDALYRIMPQDTALGSGIDEESIRLLEYAIGLEDEYILNGTVEGTVRQLTKSGDYYTYQMTEDKKYVLEFSDHAGNKYVGSIFTSCIDKTAGFTLDMDAYAMREGVGHETLDQDIWLSQEDSASFTGTVKGLPNNKFGSSGGKMQFSVDGGNTWLDHIEISKETSAVTNVSNKFILTFNENQQQVNSYNFRVITGAGTVYVHPTTYLVQKDNVTPTVNATVAYQAGGSAYNGEWTKDNLRFTISLTVGTAGGTLYYGVEEGENEIQWQAIEEIAKNGASSLTRYFVVDKSSNGAYFFKLVSGKPDTEAVSANGIAVQLDKTPVNVIAKATSNGQEVASGSWVNQEATVYPFVDSIGASGIGSVYIKVNEGTGYGEYVELTGEYEKLLSEATSTLYGYIFKVVSLSGMVGESQEFTLGYDNVAPSVSYTINGEKLPQNNEYGDWYVSNVNVELIVSQITSGYKVFLRRRASSESTYSEWAEASTSITLTDESLVGGSDYYYEFKVVTGSGIEIMVEKSAGVTEHYLPIDTNEYVVSVNTFVGEVEATEEKHFAEILGTGSYRRGDAVKVEIDPLDTYRIKSRMTSGYELEIDDYKDLSYSNARTTVDSVELVIGGANVVIDVDMYKDVTLTYSYLKQYLQEGAIRDVEFKAEEEGFDEFFGQVSKKTEGYRVGVEASYTDVEGQIVSLPSEIGTYTFALRTQAGYENFHLTNAEVTMTVVYFVGEGTSTKPYLIEDIDDFYYVDSYMHFEEGDATLDTRAYLGANRRTAYFKQMGDITLPAAFTPIGAKGEGYTNEFMGTYDGNGFEFFYPNTFAVRGDFGLFLNVNGASIINVGVRLNLRLNGVNGVNVGFIASNVENTGIRSSYAIGTVTVIDSESVTFGGLVGKGTLSLISYSFTDVSTTVISSNGYFGGIAGYLYGAYTANSYSVSRIILNECERYDALAPVGTKFAWAGALVGFVENLEAAGALPGESNKSYYLDRNLGYDGSIEKGLSLGNRDTFGRYGDLKHQGEDINFFASYESEASHANVNIQTDVTVADLVSIRINEIKAQANMSGDGTEGSPFIVDTESKLLYVETFPWAVFKQTADVMLTEGVTLSASVPFVGVYDGNGYSITGAKDNTGAIVGGVFGSVNGTIKNLKIVDVNLTYTSGGTIAGGAVGILEGGSLENVIVSGTLNILQEDSTEIVYAGGLVGVMMGGSIQDSVAILSINARGENVVSGNLVAQIQGNATLSNVVSMSSISTHYQKKADVGAVSGAITSKDASLQGVYYLANSTYANDKSIASPVGYNAGTMLDGVLFNGYQDIINVSVGGGLVLEKLGGLYPFEGQGTKQDPFKIDSYSALLLVSSYMYASFELTDNVIIGDYNDDGKLDSLDGYAYDYSPIGNGAVFTGSFDGNGYSIIGLSDSLFEVNAGSVTDLKLSLNYKVYATEKEVPDSDKVISADDATKYYTSAKIAERDEERIFGALAKVNTASGSIIRVSVSGEAYVRTLGRAKVTFGGVVGIDMGGQLAASQVSLKVSLHANQIVAGGILGEIRYSDKVLSQMATNDVMTVGAIELAGGLVIAGTYVGRVGVQTDYAPDFASDTEIIINGNSIGNDTFVGLQK